MSRKTCKCRHLLQKKAENTKNICQYKKNSVILQRLCEVNFAED